MRIDRTSKSPAALVAAPGARAPAAPASGAQSFTSSANEAALALQVEEEKTTGGRGRKPDDEKAALASIDDIAARNSLNIVERKRKDQQP